MSITTSRAFPTELLKIPQMYFTWKENGGIHDNNTSESHRPTHYMSFVSLKSIVQNLYIQSCKYNIEGSLQT